MISAQVCAAGYLGAAGLCAWSLSKIKRDDISKVSLTGAAFFISSLIHFKFGPTSVHLTFIGLIGIVLGSKCVPAIVSGLLFQAVMFQHGGISTLGLNTLVFSVPALFSGWLFSFTAKKLKKRRPVLTIFSGLIGGLGVITAGIILILILLLSNTEYIGLAYTFSVFNLALAVTEGGVTGLFVNRAQSVKPQMLYSEHRIE